MKLPCLTFHRYISNIVLFLFIFFFGLGNCHLKWLEVALGSKRTMKYVISVAISSFVSQVFYVQGLFHH